MKLNTVLDLLVLDKMEKVYEIPTKDANGNQTGINTVTSYQICVKVDGDLPQNLKLSKDFAPIFKDIQIGKINKFEIEFETNPRAYIGKDGKAAINFADVPQIKSIVPFK